MESRKVEKESRGKILWKIFLSTLYLSAFTFGGGYVIVTLMKKKFVDEYHWIGEDEMLDLVAIAQSSPGAIAVNGAIVVGYKLAGNEKLDISVLKDLKAKADVFRINRKNSYYVLFSKSGFTEAVLNEVRSDDSILLVDLAEIMTTSC